MVAGATMGRSTAGGAAGAVAGGAAAVVGTESGAAVVPVVEAVDDAVRSPAGGAVASRTTWAADRCWGPAAKLRTE
jgi:hypothetical protein